MTTATISRIPVRRARLAGMLRTNVLGGYRVRTARQRRRLRLHLEPGVRRLVVLKKVPEAFATPPR
jgi:hypothetical protein